MDKKLLLATINDTFNKPLPEGMKFLGIYISLEILMEKKAQMFYSPYNDDPYTFTKQWNPDVSGAAIYTPSEERSLVSCIYEINNDLLKLKDSKQTVGWNHIQITPSMPVFIQLNPLYAPIAEGGISLRVDHGFLTEGKEADDW